MTVELRAQGQRSSQPVRVVTAAALFDGHDAAIHIVRRLLQAQGAEVIHLGHDRSVDEIVEAAVQEDADAVAVSSYQGGHMEFFRFLIDRLRERGAGHVRVFGGGGGTILAHEAAELERYGVARVFGPDDGRKLGLPGMIASLLEEVGPPRPHDARALLERLRDRGHRDVSVVAEAISCVESGAFEPVRAQLARHASEADGLVFGITGTGGAGKSSLLDELLLRLRRDQPELPVALLLVDPTRRKRGGALLGDRIRMHALGLPNTYARSLATRLAGGPVSASVQAAISVLKTAGYRLIVVETAGIGQGDSQIVELVESALYVMTPEFGAPSQLEKIDMLELADVIVVNKCDRRGALDALRDVRKQWRRNHAAFDVPDERVPVFGCVASRFDDAGVSRVYEALRARWQRRLGLADAVSGGDGSSITAAVGGEPTRSGGQLIAAASGPSNAAAIGGELRPALARQPASTNGHARARADELAPSPPLIPEARANYLSEIARTLRDYRAHVEAQAELAARCDALARATRELSGAPALQPTAADVHVRGAGGVPQPSAAGGAAQPDAPVAAEPITPQPSAADAVRARHAAPVAAEPITPQPSAADAVRARHAALLAQLDPSLRAQLETWPERRARYRAPHQTYNVRGRDLHADNYTHTQAGVELPRVALPTTNDWAELTRFLGLSNLPGSFPFSAGVFPFRQQAETPTRMFAGEGGPEQTNHRFHLLAHGSPAARLSTAFDSVTLYGRDPDERPDIYGKVGNSGVSVATLDDAKKLYSGFDLISPRTSVSMTINGPAPIILAMFFNAAIDQAVEKHLREQGRLAAVRGAARVPEYRGELPPGHDGSGLGLLGLRGDRVVDPETYRALKADVLSRVRGTVQADILKEDQAQNTCIFSTEFALRMMGDMQAYFVAQRVQNFYSVSVSGYHIAEAGAYPITQLAFTLANAFTYVEYYLARGMKIDEFAPNFSFFFSHGLDAEYNVMGRVARRIWAIALRERYRAGERSQKLKYHTQTSGRSLHAQEMAWNDIRTTLQAVSAMMDNCNSLHTNAYDEAVTTPTEASVRAALAIQLIIQRELGLSQNENPLQGSYLIEQLTDAVEALVLEEFERLSARGGVLGSMETLYQRGRIQDESLAYESKKHTGEIPIIGVNTFVAERAQAPKVPETVRSDDAAKRAQIEELRAFQDRAGAEAEAALTRLCDVVLRGGNVFEELMETVKSASLGQISEALFRVGGRYRRAL